MAVIEIAVDSADAALAAESGGAQRLELCSALGEGGLTPSLGLVRTVRAACALTLFAIVRPRGGDFLYTATEFHTMQEDIRLLKHEGVDGVVLGILLADGHVDVARTRALVELAHPLDVTFHRAIDMTPNPERALEDVLATGVRRVLTSGGEESAWAGREALQRMVQLAAGRATILVGGGVRPGSIRQLMDVTGATEFHSSMRRLVPGPMQYRSDRLSLGGPGANDFDRSIVLSDEVRELVEAIHTAESVSH